MTPVPVCNEEQIKKQEFPRGHVNAQWPPTQQPQQEATPPPPPPPPAQQATTASSDLSSESVRRLYEEESNKEQVCLTIQLDRLRSLRSISQSLKYGVQKAKKMQAFKVCLIVHFWCDLQIFYKVCFW